MIRYMSPKQATKHLNNHEARRKKMKIFKLSKISQKVKIEELHTRKKKGIYFYKSRSIMAISSEQKFNKQMS